MRYFAYKCTRRRSVREISCNCPRRRSVVTCLFLELHETTFLAIRSILSQEIIAEVFKHFRRNESVQSNVTRTHLIRCSSSKHKKYQHFLGYQIWILTFGQLDHLQIEKTCKLAGPNTRIILFLIFLLSIIFLSRNEYWHRFDLGFLLILIVVLLFLRCSRNNIFLDCIFRMYVRFRRRENLHIKLNSISRKTVEAKCKLSLLFLTSKLRQLHRYTSNSPHLLETDLKTARGYLIKHLLDHSRQRN